MNMYSDTDRETFLEALRNLHGNISEACKSCGISRRTFYDWKEGHPAFREAYEDITEMVIDTVESALYKGILEGNVTAQIFFLKCRAKHRGYVERQEITGPDGAPINDGVNWSEVPLEARVQMLETLKPYVIKK